MRPAGPIPSDTSLVRAALAGDLRSLEVLIERHFGLVHAIALARLRDPEAAQDLAQEVFLRAQMHLGQLGAHGNFPAWVARISRNLAINWLRQGQRASRLLPQVPLGERAADVPDSRREGARDAMVNHEESEALREAIWELPDDQREVVLLHYSEELTQREIAQRLGVHQATVSRQLARALTALRRRLEPALREAAPAFRAPRCAVQRSLLIAAGYGALSASAKASLATSAPVGNLAAAAETGAAGLLGALKSITALIATGGQAMATGKGIVAAAVAVAALAAGTYLFTTARHLTWVPGAGPPPLPPAFSAAYPYSYTATIHDPGGATRTVNTTVASADGGGRVSTEALPELRGGPPPGLTVSPQFTERSDVLSTVGQLMIAAPPGDVQNLGTRDIDGVNTTGIRLPDQPVELSGERFTRSWSVWLDPATNLPYQIELSEGAPRNRQVVFDQFRYNVPGVRAPATSAPNAGDFIVGLQALAALSGGVFPAEFDSEMLIQINSVPAALVQGDPQEMKVRMDQIERARAFIGTLKARGGEWHWVGGGVRQGDPNAIVCWWQEPGGAPPRVVHGDLTVSDGDRGSLPGATSPAPLPSL